MGQNVALEAREMMLLVAAILVYPHSMIPGGVQPFDFRFPHYLQADESKWVDYRADDGSIQWVKVMLRKGELILCDRAGNCIRGRCGNDIRDESPAPKAFVPPAPHDIDTPVVAWLDGPRLEFGDVPVTHFDFTPVEWLPPSSPAFVPPPEIADNPTVRPWPGVIPLPVTVWWHRPNAPVVVTPEPGAFPLFIVLCVCCLLFRWGKE